MTAPRSFRTKTPSRTTKVSNLRDGLVSVAGATPAAPFVYPARMDIVTIGAPPTAGTSRDSPRLAPLLCAGCGAPQPIGDQDTIRCGRCGAVATLPAEYRMLRDANGMSAND